MSGLDHLKGILSISACAWVIVFLYISIRIERFIVKRYEDETDLLDTVFFKEHATFTKYIPDFFSSAMYTGHLLICLWGWGFYKNRKMYRDIDSADTITRHFSKKEIRQIKWSGVSGLILLIHIIAYYIFRSIWPEIFK